MCYKYSFIITPNRIVFISRGIILCECLSESAILQMVRDSSISHQADSGDTVDGTYITRAHRAISHTWNEIAHDMIHVIHYTCCHFRSFFSFFLKCSLTYEHVLLRSFSIIYSMSYLMLGVIGVIMIFNSFDLSSIRI